MLDAALTISSNVLSISSETGAFLQPVKGYKEQQEALTYIVLGVSIPLQ